MSSSLIGRYRVLDSLGQGAMGSVVRAFDPELGRLVAIKTLRTASGVDDVDQAQERRFVVEARAVARLRHPGIVAVYDVGRGEQGAYMVMECVQGLNLRQCLVQGVRFSVLGAAHLMDCVLAALQHAHEHHILHRDIKPENILVDAQGHVKLTDFGIAKILDTEGPQATLWDGQLIGTPRYMAPEQLRGEPLDARCDVFACGVLLFELLAGRAPFVGANVAEVVHNILHQTSASLAELNPGVSRGLDAVVQQALSKSADQRFASVAHLREALAAAVEPLSCDPAGAGLVPDRLTAWVVPDSRPLLEGLLAAVKTVDLQDCALSDGVRALAGERADIPLVPGGDVTPSGLAGLRTTQPMGPTAVANVLSRLGGWRSRSIWVLALLAVLVLWLLARPVPLPVASSASPPSGTASGIRQVPTPDSLTPGEQWVEPPSDVVSLTIDRVMKPPSRPDAAVDIRGDSGAEPTDSPSGASPSARPRSVLKPREDAQAAQDAFTGDRWGDQSRDPRAPDSAPLAQATPPEPSSSSDVPPRSVRASEPCTGLGFFQREQCLWRACEIAQYRRHPVCARFL